MPVYEVKGTKGDRVITEQVRSATKADWVAAHYVEAGYSVTITPLTSGSL